MNHSSTHHNTLLLRTLTLPPIVLCPSPRTTPLTGEIHGHQLCQMTHRQPDEGRMAPRTPRIAPFSVLKERRLNLRSELYIHSHALLPTGIIRRRRATYGDAAAEIVRSPEPLFRR